MPSFPSGPLRKQDMAGAGSQRDWSALAREAGQLAPPKKAQFKQALNWGLVRFLRAVAQETQTSHEGWAMCLRRAAKGLSEVDFAVVWTPACGKDQEKTHGPNCFSPSSKAPSEI